MNNHSLKCVLLPVVLAVIAGCEDIGRPRKAGNPDIVHVEPLPPATDTGSIWQSSSGVNASLTSDNKARVRGDIVTIVIVEKNNAQRQRNLDTTKSQATAANVGQLFFPKIGAVNGVMPKVALDSKRTSSGGGTVTESGAISDTISVQVVDVLPTGNLVLKGTKEVTISGETQTVTISGIARLKDITPDNTILSTSLAEARVHIKGKGALEDAQRRTLTNRLMDSFNLF